VWLTFESSVAFLPPGEEFRTIDNLEEAGQTTQRRVMQPTQLICCSSGLNEK
jgi:hypothetical protein